MNKLYLSIMTLFLLCACGGSSGSGSYTYDDAANSVKGAKTLEILADKALDAGRLLAAQYCDSVPEEQAALCENFYKVLDDKLATFAKGHFVELRTVLYEAAPAVYEKAGSKAELDAVKAMLEHCSAAVYIEGQRACDPPKAVRDRYKAAKSTAREAYDAAVERL